MEKDVRMKILIVEDERALSRSMCDYLSGQGYLCEQAFTCEQAMKKAGAYDYDCVLLDLMLPGGSGLDVLRKLRRSGSKAGVIIVSAKDSVDDKIAGLKIGADDYLAKPFHLSELSMRIYALLRRKDFAASNVVTSGNVSVDLPAHGVSVAGQKAELTKTEYDLLLLFISNRGHAITKSAIAEHISGEMADYVSGYNFIYSHVKNLKAKLTHLGCDCRIKTIYATGYKWEEP